MDQTTLTPVEKKEAMLQTFLETDLSLGMLCVTYQVDPATVAMWASDDKWLEKKVTHVRGLSEAASLEYTRFISQHRMGFVRQQHDLIDKISKALKDAVDRLDPDSKSAVNKLEVAAKALKSLSDVGGRLLAVADGQSLESDPKAKPASAMFVFNVAPRKAGDDLSVPRDITCDIQEVPHG